MPPIQIIDTKYPTFFCELPWLESSWNFKCTFFFPPFFLELIHSWLGVSTDMPYPEEDTELKIAIHHALKTLCLDWQADDWGAGILSENDSPARSRRVKAIHQQLLMLENINYTTNQYKTTLHLLYVMSLAMAHLLHKPKVVFHHDHNLIFLWSQHNKSSFFLTRKKKRKTAW